MAEESAYCRAYPAEELKRFPSWPDEADAALEEAREDVPVPGASGEEEAEETDVLFLHDDFTVTLGIYHGEDVVFDDVTEEWESWCRGELGFAPEEALSETPREGAGEEVVDGPEAQDGPEG